MTSYIEYKRLIHTVGGEIDRNVVRVRETRWKGSAPLLGVGVTRGPWLTLTRSTQTSRRRAASCITPSYFVSNMFRLKNTSNELAIPVFPPAEYAV
jgi:hypothetical protein